MNVADVKTVNAGFFVVCGQCELLLKKLAEKDKQIKAVETKVMKYNVKKL